MEPPDYLVIGHITRDLVEGGGFTIGGTVTYGSLTARNLGLRTAVLTSAGPDLDGLTLFDGISLHRLPSPQTTTFQNLYPDGTRVQFIRAVAGTIGPEAIPPSWRRARIVHLGPLAQEIPADMVDAFEDALIGVTPQGWMRRWGSDGLVHPRAWEDAGQVLARADVLVFSEDDVARDQKVIDAYAELANILVVTQSHRGATLYHRGGRRRFPAFVAREVDPTGAGDVFAAAFLVRLHETGDPEEATHFANCVASFCVEQPGYHGIPTREQVEDRLANGHLHSME